ncbi:MAG: carbamoyltransferase HypF [Pseudobutyrivibrio sp.]|nr:carbamoyltransferase HypF [Pseudobutyrivibrio sp.]
MIRKYTIKGLVQGIGYRPFVAGMADELNIKGWVRNTGGIVTVLACGNEADLEAFYRRLSSDVPTGGFVTSIDVETISSIEDIKNKFIEKIGTVDEEKVYLANHNSTEYEINTYKDFSIIESDQDSSNHLPLIPADIATCDRCKLELLDPNNRRFRHPFISCTICGPRYSIIEKLPYDRDTITMADFDMCPECREEYTKKLDVRRHAQTIACGKCGPKLHFMDINSAKNDEFARNLAKGIIHGKFTGEFSDKSNGAENDNFAPENANDTAISYAKDLLKKGGIVAIKDIGGYHLACNPFDEQAVANLRLLKHREAKAFAVMFQDVSQAKDYCYVNETEAELLESPARPIVLVKRRKDVENMASNVCLSSPDIGAMLPCNPLQILLVNEFGPLIMTSGNASGDVLEIDDDRMRTWLEERAASAEMSEVRLGQLWHDRRILRPMDDSVMKVVRGRSQFIRRGRGHVPNPISVDISGEIFAAGGDLKSSLCYVKNGLAYVSQYLGDLESVSCQKFYKNEMGAMAKIFGFKPEAAVADLHPSYFSRKAAKEKFVEKKQEACASANVNLVFVQHHKAHVAAVIAEHHLSGPVLGFAFDGTGYGEDGCIWGSEVFVWADSSMTRVAHLKPMKLIGGDEGAKNCDTILAAMLYDNGISLPESKEVNGSNEADIKEIFVNQNSLIKAALDNNINIVESTSMGRLFDAVSALLDVCHYNTYEGQAPIELENLAATTDEVYQLSIDASGDVKGLLENIVYAISNKVNKAQIARGFIYAVADYIVAIADENNIRQVVLSGGTFLNRILLERTIDLLEEKEYIVYTAEQLPPGDGGICLGQAYLLEHENSR